MVMEKEYTLVILAGLGDSGPEHWQYHWLKHFSNAIKVEHDSWDRPHVTHWLARLNETMTKLNKPVIFVAHSLAVSLVMHWVKHNPDITQIAGAFLVAPADVDSADHTPEEIRNFSPMPLERLPFPSVVVASENDTYISLQRAAFFAQQWGSDFISVGQRDHIGTVAKLGLWQEGLDLFADFFQRRVVSQR